MRAALLRQAKRRQATNSGARPRRRSRPPRPERIVAVPPTQGEPDAPQRGGGRLDRTGCGTTHKPSAETTRARHSGGAAAPPKPGTGEARSAQRAQGAKKPRPPGGQRIAIPNSGARTERATKAKRGDAARRGEGRAAPTEPRRERRQPSRPPQGGAGSKSAGGGALFCGAGATDKADGGEPGVCRVDAWGR